MTISNTAAQPRSGDISPWLPAIGAIILLIGAGTVMSPMGVQGAALMTAICFAGMYVMRRVNQHAAAFIFGLVFGHAVFVAALVFLTQNGFPVMLTAGLCGLACVAAFFVTRVPVLFLFIPGSVLLAMFDLMRTGDGTPPAVPIVIAGVACLVLAVFLDLKDRYRTTEYHRAAFWVYLGASPLTLHPLMLQTFSSFGAASATSIIIVLFLCALFTVFALLMNRRGPVVTTLIYVAWVVAVGVSSRTNDVYGNPFGDYQNVFAVVGAPFLAVGVYVMVIGVFWNPIRTAFLGLLPASIVDGLPSGKGLDEAG